MVETFLETSAPGDKMKALSLDELA
jgi:hypothetical protein